MNRRGIMVYMSTHLLRYSPTLDLICEITQSFPIIEPTVCVHLNVGREGRRERGWKEGGGREGGWKEGGREGGRVGRRGREREGRREGGKEKGRMDKLYISPSSLHLIPNTHGIVGYVSVDNITQPAEQSHVLTIQRGEPQMTLPRGGGGRGRGRGRGGSGRGITRS